MKKIIYIMSMAALVSSCSIYKKFQAPDIDQSNVCGENIATVDSLIATPSWREVFVDPCLQDLIEQGLKSNSDLRIAKLNIDKAEAALLTSKLSYIPSFTLSPEGATGSFKGSSPAYTYNLPVVAQWEIDVFGKIRNRKQQAKASFEQSQQYMQMVQSQIVSAIANNYYTLIMLDEQLNILTQSIELYRQSLEIITAMKEVGMQTEAAVNQAQASYLDIQASKIELQTQINAAENSLSLLINMPPHKILRSVYGSKLIENISIDKGISLVALANRPDVKVAESTLSSSFYGVNVARSALYPSIRLSGVAGWSNNSGAMIVNPGGWLLSAVASVTQPLFNAGANRANLKIAKAQYEQSLIEFEKTLLIAGAEVNDAITVCQNSESQAKLRRAQVEASRRAYENSVEIMKHSSQTYLEIIAAQGSLLEAQIAELANWMQGVQGNISLFKALGGGA